MYKLFWSGAVPLHLILSPNLVTIQWAWSFQGTMDFGDNGSWFLCLASNLSFLLHQNLLTDI